METEPVTLIGVGFVVGFSMAVCFLWLEERARIRDMQRQASEDLRESYRASLQDPQSEEVP